MVLRALLNGLYQGSFFLLQQSDLFLDFLKLLLLTIRRLIFIIIRIRCPLLWFCGFFSGFFFFFSLPLPVFGVVSRKILDNPLPLKDKKMVHQAVHKITVMGDDDQASGKIV